MLSDTGITIGDGAVRMVSDVVMIRNETLLNLPTNIFIFQTFLSANVPCNLNTVLSFWWLVRVTLVIDLWFLPQNFGPMVGTYEDLLLLCECR